MADASLMELGALPVAPTPEKIEWGEVQRLVLSGYPKLVHARFLLLRVEDPAKARAWVKTLVEENLVRFGWGERHHLTPAMAVAFTWDGFTALGVDEKTLDGFSPEFVEGMTALGRPRKFGDTAESAPSEWVWGVDAWTPHALLAVYAADEPALARTVAREIARLESSGLSLLTGRGGEELGRSRPLDDRREHFGFADGLSQPRFKDEPGGRRSKTVHEADKIAAGELLLGYENEAELFPRSPVISPALAARAPFPRKDGDLGRNGSYLVYRQLEQDVGAFWKAMGALGESPSVEDRVYLASKIVGRWPDGAPLVTKPSPNEPGARDLEAFDYAHDDPDGLKCPFGSHIRRSNPRATLARDPDMGLAKSKKHRLLRRGRPYGEPFVPSMAPADLAAAADGGTGAPGERGIHFLCFNADIANQFEFVQQTWTNGPIFQGLHGEVDPLVGDPAPTGGLYSIPCEPFRKRIHGLPRFVKVRGGAYFFAPSRTALLYLSSIV
ncbi:MAG TPA: Dyp-type peroxidase [Polyangiaceae bacterium]|nr:Dyp-type peroxidase [Polyangiaceae bacterium]